MDFNDAFEEDYEAFRGQLGAILKHLKAAVTRHFSNDDDVTWYYVGIASNGVAGCRNRWNQKYKPDGFNRMRAIYHTNSNDFVRQAERELIYHNWEDPKCCNQVGGGGGRLGPPTYIVYVAYKQKYIGITRPF
ncbi:MAG: hypothetical protein PHI31_12720 [Desulfuromonadaceae bacterium]|nr:hypothetical protein [Desulfuromonadaceae bacterium]